MLFLREKGQSVTGEYVVVIALVSIAIVSMTVFVRRALQARYHDANQTVYMRAASVLGNTVQPEYEPYYVNTTTDTEFVSSVKEVAAGDAVNRTDASDRSTSTSSTQLPF